MVPMCTIGMDGPHVYNRDGWSLCVRILQGVGNDNGDFLPSVAMEICPYLYLEVWHRSCGTFPYMIYIHMGQFPRKVCTLYYIIK